MIMRKAPIGASCGTGLGGRKALDGIDARVMALPPSYSPEILGAAARDGYHSHARREEGSECRALADGGGERAFVEIIELAADRHAVREAGPLDRIGAEEIRDVMGRRLAL